MPVLIYTVWALDDSGSGASGLNTDSPVSTLVIYDNGLATWNRSDANGTGTSGCSGNCVDTVQLSSSEVNNFIQNLRRAGAFRQSSNNASAGDSDTALVTVTVFTQAQGSVSLSRTFSFFTSDDGTTSQQGRAGQIQNSFTNFFNTNFGGNDSGSGSGSGGGTGTGSGS